ncbi:MAG: F0F1 ATP synthase subunit B [Patescibacteria group bacterium]
MSEMLTKLGIDWKLFIAQLINFTILFLILRTFAWKPISAALEARRKKIRKGVEDAKRAEEQLQSIESERNAALGDARKQALQIIDEAKKKADKINEDKMRMAKEEIEHHIDEAKEQIRSERNASYLALKQDLAVLIKAATGKIIANLDNEAQEKLVQDAIRDIETA